MHKIVATLALATASVLASPAVAAHAQTAPPHWLVKGQDMAYNGSPDAVAADVNGIGISACARGTAPCPAQNVTLPALSWQLCGTWNGKVYGKSDYTTCTAPPDTLVVEGENMLQHAITDGLFQSTGIRTVMLDFESWAYTPADEQVSPLATIRTAVTVAHASGLRLIVSVGGTFAHCTACMSAAAAAGAYMVAAQTQGGTSLATFETYVAAAATAVRSARGSGGTMIMIGLATNTPTPHSLSLLNSEYNYARGLGVSNFWPNANNWESSNVCTSAEGGPGCPQTAVDFWEGK